MLLERKGGRGKGFFFFSLMRTLQMGARPSKPWRFPGYRLYSSNIRKKTYDSTKKKKKRKEKERKEDLGIFELGWIGGSQCKCNKLINLDSDQICGSQCNESDCF